MIFDHVVKYNNKYYSAGENVPINDKNVGASISDAPVFLQEDIIRESADKYTKEQLSEMTVKEIKTIASKLGFSIKKISPKEDVIDEFLEKQ